MSSQAVTAMMFSFKHFFLTYFLMLCCVLNPQDSAKENAVGGRFMQEGRIFGPEEPERIIKTTQFPFLVFIQIIAPHLQKEYVCSGSLVTPSAIITSSLCMSQDKSIAFWAGNNRFQTQADFEPPAQGRELKYYKKFGEYFINSTLCFAITTKPFIMTDYVKTVGLYRDKTELELTWHDDCYVFGFGAASPVVDDSRVGRYMIQRIWSRIACKEFPPLQGWMCANHDVYQKTICLGDIGGPVLCTASPGKMKQFGIVEGRITVDSRMMDLDCLLPQVENRYLFIGYFHNFIKEIPDLPLDGPSYPPINSSLEPTDKEKEKGSGARSLKVPVQMLHAAITSSILARGRVT